MRLLLLFVLVPLFVLAQRQATLDDLLDSARQSMRHKATGAHTAAVTSEVPPPAWNIPLALAGTTVIVTAVLMAFTALLAEFGMGFRRPRRVRIRLVPWHEALSQRHLPQVNLL